MAPAFDLIARDNAALKQAVQVIADGRLIASSLLGQRSD
jgi:hypothetical protein